MAKEQLKKGRLVTALVSGLIIIVVLFGIAYITSPQGFRERFFAAPYLGPVNFKTLEKTARPNQYLMCPKDFCKKTRPDSEPPVYGLPAEELKAKWVEMMGTQRAEVVNETAFTIDYLNRSPIMGFPDSTSVEFIKLDKNKSTLAIYARAHKGYFDFGANSKRVRRWVKRLNQVITLSQKKSAQ